MTRAYTAILQGDRLEWTGEGPTLPSDQKFEVQVTFSKPRPVPPSSESIREAREAMRRIAERGGLDHIRDAVEWQREQRRDRPLPGRE